MSPVPFIFMQQNGCFFGQLYQQQASSPVKSRAYQEHSTAQVLRVNDNPGLLFTVLLVYCFPYCLKN